MATKQLIAGLHVGQVQVGEHVRQESQKTITDSMPKEEDPVWTSADKPRSVNHIGEAVEDGLKQEVVFGWIVLQIGILDDDIFSLGLTNPAVQCSSLTHVVFLGIDTHRKSGVCLVVLFQSAERIVAGAIVNDHDFHIESANQLYRTNLVENSMNGRRFVVGRNDYRQFLTHAVW